MRFDQAMLFVKDIKGMADFYTQVIGFQPLAETRLDNWVEFETGGARFSLHAIPPDLAKDIDVADPPVPREETPYKFVFTVADADAELTRLTGLGVTILHRPWGGWDAVDPEGNVFGVRQEVP